MEVREAKKLLDLVRNLISVSKEGGLEEVEIKVDKYKIKISWKKEIPTSSSILTFPNITQQPLPTPTPKKTEESTQTKTTKDEFEDSSRFHKVLSPITGTFYRAPSPGAPPFVEVGQFVTPDQTLCIVEAMKVMNEIKAGVSGKVVKILKNNAELVKAGEVLFIIETS